MEEDIKKMGVKLSFEEENKIRFLMEALFLKIIQSKNPKFQIRPNLFLGSHALSMSRESLQRVFRYHNDYLVCEKSDGIRYIMIVTDSGEVILTGRGSKNGYNDLHMINFPLVRGLIDKQENNKKINFMFDGELVQEKVDSEIRLTYLFFDCMVYDGKLEFDKEYKDRIGNCTKFLNTRNLGFKICKQVNPIGIIVSEPCRKLPEVFGRVKTFYPVEESVNLFQNFAPTLPYETDGLIFVRNSVPYQTGKTSDVLKWKPLEKITIDFMAVPNPKLSEELNCKIVELYVSVLIKDEEPKENQIEGNTSHNEYYLFDFLVPSDKDYDKIVEKSVPITLNANLLETKGCIVECKLNFSETNEGFSNLLTKAKENIDQFVDNWIKNKALTNLDEETKKKMLVDFKTNLKKKGNKDFWIVERIRFDKIYPNLLNTAIGTLDDIFNGPSIKDIEREVVPLKENLEREKETEKEREKEKENEKEKEKKKKDLSHSPNHRTGKTSRKSSHDRNHDHHRDVDRHHHRDHDKHDHGQRHHHDHKHRHRYSGSEYSDYSDYSGRSHERSRRGHRHSGSRSPRHSEKSYHSRHSGHSGHSKHSGHRYRDDSRDRSYSDRKDHHHDSGHKKDKYHDDKYKKDDRKQKENGDKDKNGNGKSKDKKAKDEKHEKKREAENTPKKEKNQNQKTSETKKVHEKPDIEEIEVIKKVKGDE